MESRILSQRRTPRRLCRAGEQSRYAVERRGPLHRSMAAVQLQLRGRDFMNSSNGLNGRSERKLLAGHGDLELFGDELERLDNALRRRVNADRASLEKGLAQLVPTL